MTGSKIPDLITNVNRFDFRNEQNGTQINYNSIFNTSYTLVICFYWLLFLSTVAISGVQMEAWLVLEWLWVAAQLCGGVSFKN